MAVTWTATRASAVMVHAASVLTAERTHARGATASARYWTAAASPLAAPTGTLRSTLATSATAGHAIGRWKRALGPGPPTRSRARTTDVRSVACALGDIGPSYSTACASRRSPQVKRRLCTSDARRLADVVHPRSLDRVAMMVRAGYYRINDGTDLLPCDEACGECRGPGAILTYPDGGSCKACAANARRGIVNMQVCESRLTWRNSSMSRTGDDTPGCMRCT